MHLEEKVKKDLITRTLVQVQVAIPQQESAEAGAGGGGGDHCKPGGGYSGGAGEPFNLGGENGECTKYVANNGDSVSSLAGGYYNYTYLSNNSIINGWFGLGGCYASENSGYYR